MQYLQYWFSNRSVWDKFSVENASRHATWPEQGMAGCNAKDVCHHHTPQSFKDEVIDKDHPCQ